MTMILMMVFALIRVMLDGDEFHFQEHTSSRAVLSVLGTVVSIHFPSMIPKEIDFGKKMRQSVIPERETEGEQKIRDKRRNATRQREGEALRRFWTKLCRNAVRRSWNVGARFCRPCRLGNICEAFPFWDRLGRRLLCGG